MAIKYQSTVRETSKAGELNDCTVKALSIIADVPYKVAHHAMHQAGRRNWRGADRFQQKDALESLGFEQKRVDFKPCQVRTVTRQLDPKKIYRVHVRGHALAVRYGKVEDWSEGSARRVQEIFEITPKVSKNARRKAKRYGK